MHIFDDVLRIPIIYIRHIYIYTYIVFYATDLS